MNRDGTEHKKLTEESELAVLGKMSRDGTRIMYLRTIVTPQQPGQPAEKAQAPKQELVIYNLANDKFSVVEEVPLNATLTSYCWSPDGKQIAYTWQEKYVGKPEDAGTAEVESHLMVCDVTGKNAKTIHSHKTPPYRVAIGGVDWR
jgi:Tol biopolymer transport system component